MRTAFDPDPPRPRPRDAHKASVGRVLVVGGSRNLCGAPYLAGLGALHAGAGLVRAAVPRPLQPIVAGYGPDLLTAGLPATRSGGLSRAARAPALALAQEADAVVLGPGAGREPVTLALLRALAADLPVPLVLDADALFACVGRWALLRRRKAATVLTPHEGEAARLLRTTSAAVRADRAGAHARLCAASGGIVVLKGPGTLVGDGARRYRCPHGSAVLATGGSGDVLAGMIAALLAERGTDTFEAAATAVAWHARAGDLVERADPGRRGLPASTLALTLAPALSAWRRLGARGRGRGSG